MTTLAHPLITITNIIWSFDPATKQVNVLLIKRSDQPFAGYWALPETAMREGESAHEAALRLVREKIGLRLDAGYAEQLATFTAADRDPSERALSLSYMIYLPQRPPLVPGPGASDAEWFALSRQPGGIFTFNYQRLRFYSLKADEYLTDQTPTTGLAFDHNWILTVACSRIRNKLDYQHNFVHSWRQFHAQTGPTDFCRIRPHRTRQLQLLAEPRGNAEATGVTAKAGVGRPSKTYVLTLR